MIKYAVAVSVAVVMGAVVAGFSQGQSPAPCEVGAPPTAEQIARRRLAINGARQINTAEAKTSATSKRFVPLSQLTGVSLPAGFEAQVSTDGTSYTFSIKDMQDACKFAVFSDQTGVIYTASPLQ